MKLISYVLRSGNWDDLFVTKFMSKRGLQLLWIWLNSRALLYIALLEQNYVFMTENTDFSREILSYIST